MSVLLPPIINFQTLTLGFFFMILLISSLPILANVYFFFFPFYTRSSKRFYFARCVCLEFLEITLMAKARGKESDTHRS